MKYTSSLYRMLTFYILVSRFSCPVDLQISNTSDHPIWATARTGASGRDLTLVEPGAVRQYIENITPNDQLTIYFDQQGKMIVWGKFRITLGGQRNEPIDLTFAGSACTGYELQDILGEPGEGGYNIQDLYVTPLRLTPCYFKRIEALKLIQEFDLPASSK